MADEMLERVRLAIMDCEAAGSISASAARVVARAAIAAMREPTDTMLAAGLDAAPEALENGDGVSGHYRDEVAPEVWRAMIDAAMSP